MTTTNPPGPVGVTVTPSPPAALQVVGLVKSYGSTTVLRDITLDVRRGETLCVIGPSGSGKSTLLKCLNLLETPDSGEIWLGETCLTSPRADVDGARARIGMVFQHFNLFPHMSVERNVTVALTSVKGMGREEAREIAHRRLTEVGLASFAGQRPGRPRVTRGWWARRTGPPMLSSTTTGPNTACCRESEERGQWKATP